LPRVGAEAPSFRAAFIFPIPQSSNQSALLVRFTPPPGFESAMGGSSADFGLAIERRFARSSGMNEATSSARPACHPRQGDVVMMEESLHGEFRPTSLGHRQYKSRRAAGLPKTFCATLMHTFDPTLQHRSTRSASLDVTVAAIRPWRARARSRQELRELSDHMLRDIGLRREDLGYEFPEPFWHD
jgi:uncharacterized protein YjiS (DUF1127 family)